MESNNVFFVGQLVQGFLKNQQYSKYQEPLNVLYFWAERTLPKGQNSVKKQGFGTVIFQFPMYLEPGADPYLIIWQQRAWFQICRELEDKGIDLHLS